MRVVARLFVMTASTAAMLLAPSLGSGRAVAQSGVPPAQVTRMTFNYNRTVLSDVRGGGVSGSTLVMAELRRNPGALAKLREAGYIFVGRETRMELSREARAAGLRTPSRIRLFFDVKRVGSGALIDSVEVPIRYNADGTGIPEAIAFPGIADGSDRYVELQVMLVGGDIPAGTVFSLDLEYRAAKNAKKPTDARRIRRRNR